MRRRSSAFTNLQYWMLLVIRCSQRKTEKVFTSLMVRNPPASGLSPMLHAGIKRVNEHCHAVTEWESCTFADKSFAS